MDYNKDTIAKKGWGSFREELYMIPQVDELLIQTETIITDLSQRLYGNKDVWWLLMEYNKLPISYTVQSGVKLKLFRISDLNILVSKYIKTYNSTNRGLV